MTSSDFLVFCSLRPGPHYFCASLLSQSPNFLLLTFFLFHGSDLAKCKLYDHITPLLKIFGWLPIVLRIESRLAVLASRSLCALTVVSFFCFMALFHPQSCPSPLLQCTIVLSYAFHASLWACCLRPVSAVTPPTTFLVSNSYLQLLFKTSKFSCHLTQNVASDRPHSLLSCTIIAVSTAVLYLSAHLPLLTGLCWVQQC